MLVYLFLLFLALVNLFFVKDPKIKIPSFIIIGFMFVLCAFRAESIGTDTSHYADILNGTRGNAEEKMQYQLLFALLVLIGRETSFTFFLTLFAGLTYFPLYFVLRKETGKFLPVAILLFIVSMQAYFICSMNIMRQILATVLLLISVSDLNRKRYFSCAIWYVAALLMHTISLVFLPFMLLSQIRISYKTVVYIVAGSVLFAFVFSSIFSMETIAGFLDGNEFLNLYHFLYYFEDNTEHYGILGMIKQLLPTAFICLYSYKVLDGHFYCRLYMWGLVFLCIATPFTTFALRFSMGLYATELFIIPMTYKTLTAPGHRKFKLGRIPLDLYMVFLVVYFLYTAFSLYIDDKAIVPYKFIFE